MRRRKVGLGIEDQIRIKNEVRNGVKIMVIIRIMLMMALVWLIVPSSTVVLLLLSDHYLPANDREPHPRLDIQTPPLPSFPSFSSFLLSYFR